MPCPQHRAEQLPAEARDPAPKEGQRLTGPWRLKMRVLRSELCQRPVQQKVLCFGYLRGWLPSRSDLTLGTNRARPATEEPGPRALRPGCRVRVLQVHEGLGPRLHKPATFGGGISAPPTESRLQGTRLQATSISRASISSVPGAPRRRGGNQAPVPSGGRRRSRTISSSRRWMLCDHPAQAARSGGIQGQHAPRSPRPAARNPHKPEP